MSQHVYMSHVHPMMHVSPSHTQALPAPHLVNFQPIPHPSPSPTSLASVKLTDIYPTDAELRALKPQDSKWLPPQNLVFTPKPRRLSSEPTSGKPPNAFMLFRSVSVAPRLPEDESQQNVSRVAGEIWAALPDTVKKAWQAEADKIREKYVLRSVETDSPSRRPAKMPKPKERSEGGVATRRRLSTGSVSSAAVVANAGIRKSTPSRTSSPRRKPSPQPVLTAPMPSSQMTPSITTASIPQPTSLLHTKTPHQMSLDALIACSSLSQIPVTAPLHGDIWELYRKVNVLLGIDSPNPVSH